MRRRVENVKLKLGVAGTGTGAAVPGLGQKLAMTRGDVEDWLAEQDREAAKRQIDTLWWAKAATWIGVAGILVAM
jgi:hypothetical protein